MSSKNQNSTQNINQTPQLFDVIVGNPPYGSHLDEKSKEYLHKIYPNVPDYEIYMYFLRKGLDLLNENGILSYIFPNTFLSINNGIELRNWILDNFDILRITDLSNDKTFEDASVRTCIFTVRKSKRENNITEFWEIIPNEKKFQKKSEFSREFLKENASNWLALFSHSKENQKVIDKMKNGQKVADICEVSQGYIPYRRSDLVKNFSEIEGNKIVDERLWHSEIKVDENWKQEILGKNLSRYSYSETESYVKYGKHVASYVNPKFFENPRILVREIADENLFCAYLEKVFYNNPSIINIIHPENDKVVLKFILGVLNTKLMGWYHQNTSPKAKKGLFPKILVNDVRNLPLPVATPEQQTQIAEVVDKIIELKKDLQNYLNNTFVLWNSDFGQSIKINKKLENFHTLSFEEFVVELEKQKVKLERNQKRDLITSFETDKKTVLLKIAEVEKIDEKIEKLVRELYKLNQINQILLKKSN